jgi:hypothetical protein
VFQHGPNRARDVADPAPRRRPAAKRDDRLAPLGLPRHSREGAGAAARVRGRPVRVRDSDDLEPFRRFAPRDLLALRLGPRVQVQRLDPRVLRGSARMRAVHVGRRRVDEPGSRGGARAGDILGRGHVGAPRVDGVGLARRGADLRGKMDGEVRTEPPNVLADHALARSEISVPPL